MNEKHDEHLKQLEKISENHDENSDYDEEKNSDDGSMSISSHLEELRSRIIKSLIAVAIGSFASFTIVEDITSYLAKPAGKLYYMQPSEAFFTYIKIAIVCGFLLALPVIFYHVWKFFLPAFTKSEKAILAIIVPASVILFFSGLAFSFFLVLPAGIHFFMGFGGEDLQALFSVDKYFDFVVMFVLPFGFVFELPLIITILGKIGLLTSEFLSRYKKIVFFLSFVIGAIITPTPDVFTQSMIALPMIALYEVGYLIVKYIIRN